MTLITPPVMSDDSGSKVDGTIVDEAFIESLLDLVDDQTHSLVNPTVKPKTTTDEVIAGRGGQASLDARFDAIDVQITDLVTRLTTDTAATANVGAGEDTLKSYSVPAGTLAVNGELLEFELFGTTTNNANAKTLRLYFGGTLFAAFVLTVNSSANWAIRGQIIRTGAATQFAWAQAQHTLTGPTTQTSSASPTATLSGAVILLVTGEATTNNDIVLLSTVVKKVS